MMGRAAPPHPAIYRVPPGDKTSATDDFSSCSFIPLADFEKSLVMVSYYGYEI